MAPKKGSKKEEPKTKAASMKEEEPKAEPVQPGMKRKAEEPAADDLAAAQEPPKKETKVEEQVENEKDEPVDKRKAFDSIVGFNLSDTTLNVIPTFGGKVLASLSDGGLQYLIGGARANVGVKTGRYLFEVKIVEVLPLPELGHGGRKGGAGGLSRALLRVGFSTAGSPLVLGESEEHVYFDGEGGAHAGRKRCATFRRFVRDQTIGILLNLDPKSENKNTFSCFIDGVRVVQPQPLPESLAGKVLFPHISFRNIKVMAHFGPKPMKDLPFACRTCNGGIASDLIQSEQHKGKDGKFEVLFPVGFPDEGTFDWLDTFLAKHPQYVELSDRKIMEWAAVSGLMKPRGYQACNDKPEFNFGLPGLDDGAIRNIMNSVATLMPRNYVVMEVKANLLEAERQKTLKRFSAPCYKKIAQVVMGQPSPEFKQLEHAKILKDKQARSDATWRAQKAEKKRKREAARRAKEIAEAKKKADEENKKKADEAAKETKDAEGTKEGEEKKEDEGEGKTDAMDVDGKKGEDQKMGEPAKVEEAEAEEDEDDDTEPPKVELTDEENALNFAPRQSQDLTWKDLNQSFDKFSIPEQSEGFDEIKYVWQKDKAAKEYLHEKVLQQKKQLRVEDLQPGEWFKETSEAWIKTVAEWQEKLAVYKGSDAGKADATRKKDEESKTSEKSLDAVEDVADVGNGEPLFKDFTYEDWALLQLRFELLTLQAAFKKDVRDEDRPGVQEQHFAFYFNRYFGKNPNFRGYGVEGATDLVKLVKDTAAFEEDVLVSKAKCEPENFAALVKLCESARRDRARRLDAGDESARLKIHQDVLKVHAQGGKVGGKKGGGKGNKKW